MTSASRSIERVDAVSGARTVARDAIVEEAPLVVRAQGTEVMVVMRTPGADLELVRGLCFAEGVPAAPLAQTAPDEVTVELDPARFARRALTASAACGVCGRAAIADLELRARPVEAEWQVEAAIVAALPSALAPAQETFAATGGLHAAGLFDQGGRLLAVREDVGRHNAVDKLVGWGLDAGVRFPDSLLVLSGRLGYELAQKAVCVGIPLVAAVSAPSTLAIDLCERFGVTACGFVRAGRFNVYSHGWRILTSGPG